CRPRLPTMPFSALHAAFSAVEKAFSALKTLQQTKIPHSWYFYFAI
ncbi:MAG: hypothetical protein ACI87V_000710, partial [Flavobacteriales bacterium]